MPLILLGIFFIIATLLYYGISKHNAHSHDQDENAYASKDTTRQEGNVIYLPGSYVNPDSPLQGTGDGHTMEAFPGTRRQDKKEELHFVLFENNEAQSELLRYLKNAAWAPAKLLYETWTEDRFYTDYGKNAELYFLKNRNVVAGFGAIVERILPPLSAYRCFLAFLYIDSAYRGRNLERRLITFLEERARACGESKVHILTEHAGLYEQMGYRKVQSIQDGIHAASDLFFKPL